jgi:Tol biopolymer transport system component
LLGFVGVLFLQLRETTTAEKSVRFQVSPPEKAAFLMFKLSPDGRYLAFVATGGGQSRLWVRALDAVEAKVIPATEGATYPFWSLAVESGSIPASRPGCRR